MASDYPYLTDPDDHCETPLVAYQHILPVLEIYSQSCLEKEWNNIKIYDPYFCEGGALENLTEIGFKEVYHKKEDFYENIKNNQLPEYDVLVTNPPYSDEHIPKILKFMVSSKKPGFLLVPNFVYVKDYFHEIVRNFRDVMYICPNSRYKYATPKGRRQKKSSNYTAPFPTFWFCFNLPPQVRRDSLRLKVGSDFGIYSSTDYMPLDMLPEQDWRKKKEKNKRKRKNNKSRKKKPKLDETL